MPQILEGQLVLRGDESIAIAVSRFNEHVTQKLLDGALETLSRHGADLDRVTVAWVPGAYELPLAAECLVGSGLYAAVLCLGAVVQGETSHHEAINFAVSEGLMRVGLDSRTPVLFGVLTCHTMEQALDRAGGKVGNKGSEVALAAIEMIDLLRQHASLPGPR